MRETNYMDYEKILNQVQMSNNYYNIEPEAIDKLMNCDDELIRCDAIEKLFDFIDIQEVQDIILHSVNDESYLVRCTAYEGLGMIKNNDNILNQLVNLLPTETNNDAKMYLLSAICTLIKIYGFNENTVNAIDMINEEQAPKKVRIALMCVKYCVNNDKSLIDRIIYFLSDSDYHIRCCAINLLHDIIDNSNKCLILSRYKEQLKTETSCAVKELLKDEIALLDS